MLYSNECHHENLCLRAYMYSDNLDSLSDFYTLNMSIVLPADMSKIYLKENSVDPD